MGVAVHIRRVLVDHGLTPARTAASLAAGQAAEGGASALNLGDDVVGGGLPDEWFWVLVLVLGPRGDRGGEVGDARECATAQAFVGEFFEPAFDQVQPRTRSRRVVQVPAAGVVRRSVSTSPVAMFIAANKSIVPLPL